MVNKKVKILCVFTRILGNEQLSERYIKAINYIEDIDPTYLFVEGEDYKNYPAPLWVRFSAALEIAFIARKKFETILNNSDFDSIIISGYEMTFGFKHLIEKMPTIVILDVVPSLVHSQIIKTTQSFFKKIKSYIARFVTSRVYKQVFKRVDLFLPLSNWCKNELINNYGIEPDNIFVTYYPLDEKVWKCKDNKINEKFTLLFIGNDFYRKGGKLILELFENHLSIEEFKLQVISNDPVLDLLTMPKGIEVYKDIPNDEIARFYRAADLFLFPSLKDNFGIVVAEACMCGLPVIASNVGGVGDMVIDGYNGYLLLPNAKAEDWVEKIRYLKDSSNKFYTYSKNSRDLAENKLTFYRFKKLLISIIKREPND